jgi:hypothetical protein
LPPRKNEYRTGENFVDFNFVSANLNKSIKVEFLIKGQNPQTLLNSEVVIDPVSGNYISVELPSGQTWVDEDSIVCRVKDSDNNNLLTVSLALNNVVTGIHDFEDELNEDFHLSQNYPNPFNPTTIINFNTPVESFVNLKVYDIMGREVVEIISEEKPAGNYSVTFDGSGLSSGIYFYRIQSGSYNAVRRMLLLK